MLPVVKTPTEYRLVYRREETWRPAMQAICDRHGLDSRSLTLGPPGTHVVFRAGSDVYIKLFCPLWDADYGAELAVLRALATAPPLPVPHLVAAGQIEDWPYLLLTAVPGTPLEQVRDRLSERDRVRVLRDLGQFLRALHAVPTKDLSAVALDWDAFIEERAATRIREIRDAARSPRWVESTVAFLEDLPSLLETGSPPVLLSADVTDEHVLVTEQDGRWTFSGYVDFGDAVLGPSLHEFAAPAACITQGSPENQRALLYGYGLEEAELDRRLADRLTAHVLVHRYIRIDDLFASLAPTVPADLDDLRRALWSFG